MTSTPRFTRTASYRAWLIDEPQRAVDQARQEGAALRGEFGVERQLVAMSELYKALKAEGRMEEAAAVRAEGMRIIEARG